MKTFVILFLVALHWSTPADAGTLWGYCKGAKAFQDPTYSKRKPDADKICKLKTAKEVGDPVAGARCLNSQDDICHNRHGEFGPNDVPNGAWYYVATGSVKYPRARCQCGCFPGQTRILTTDGYAAAEDLFDLAAAEDIRLAIPVGQRFEASQPLTRAAFTIGDEVEPLIQITTASGRTLLLTTIHPVPVLTEQGIAMIQAKDLTRDNVMFNGDGSPTRITALQPVAHGKIKVFNVDTQAEGGERHLLVANGLKIGDLAWQNQLALHSSRRDNLLARNAP